MNRSRIIAVLVVSIGIIAALATDIVPSAAATDRPWKAEAALKRLSAVSGGTMTLEWSPETGTPSRIEGKLSSKTKHSPAWIAIGFMNKYRALYGIRDVQRELRIEGVERHADGHNVYLRHMLFRTPVREDRLTVALDKDGVVREVAGTFYPGLETKLNRIGMHSAYSERDAIRVALRHASGELANEPAAERYYLASRKGTPLVYIVTLPLRDPDRTQICVVHSMTGRIIDQQTTAR
ncbi:hypothetical protein [Cohnella panacarvi]|uniref:hypothetical protein n=1 Tax=Cohnella panacarvi TaxID=400776 RepID=UPI00047A6A69|nr:hypothetical protein [Cohnella panacarvi]